ncbi:flagellar motor protein MotB [Flavobacterium amnicola]|uniref:Flagellar motor protein MotB n=1 Tax=Flavobacterium amnicola TaxID=2506422 RepID=A0A4Q1K3P5_9FLAO|nr:OmpA family protein [Flavobacterium amnicola]RXR20436.1 flagellar motor protein MotB [Flavobacterium amnicola]
MKRQIQIIFVTLLTSFSFFAQETKVAKANSQYDNLAYVDAIKTYEKIVAKGYKSVNLFQKLGDSYYFNANLLEANKWYNELFVLNEKVAPEYYYRYSQTLKATGDYTKANQFLDKFYELAGNDLRGKYYSEQKNYKEIIAKNSGRYEIKATEVNTKAFEYGPYKYGDKVLFSTSRDSIGYAKIKTKWTGLSFTNLYAADLSEDGSLVKPKRFSNKLNSKFHEDTPVFTKDLKTVYFTRNNYNDRKVGKSADKLILIKLYKATLEGEEWTNVKELPFNSDDFSTAHPALSPDEKTLYFATNRPGTTGQSDLYKVAILGNDTYGEPVKLTGGINTEGRETFPYVNENNELYFASDGHQGLGGLDIFMAKLDENGMPTKAVNVGEPVNSPQDDFALIIDATTKKGFFTSNRAGGKGLDDIYSFIENKPLEMDYKHDLEGAITDLETNQVIPGATVTLFDDKFNTVATTTADENGNYNFKNIDAGKKYYVRSEKEDYDTVETPILIPNKAGKTQLPIKKGKKVKEIKVGTDLAKTFDIKIIYFDLDKSNIRKDAALELEKILDVMQQNPTLKIDVRSHTDCRQTADYNMKLSERRAKSTIAWLVKNGISKTRLTGKGYGESQLTNDCGCEPTNNSSCSEEQHQQNRRSEFIIVSMN